jgi:ketosteroid isomerase-like protein
MQPTPELSIRLARAAFNRALVEADLPAIGPILSPDAILVTGTDSAAIVGRRAQLLVWKREFAANERTTYTRLPHTIEVSPVHPIAFEHGAWQAVTVPTVEVSASGSYTAKWRRTGDTWMIEAELYLTLL